MNFIYIIFCNKIDRLSMFLNRSILLVFERVVVNVGVCAVRAQAMEQIRIEYKKGCYIIWAFKALQKRFFFGLHHGSFLGRKLSFILSLSTT